LRGGGVLGRDGVMRSPAIREIVRKIVPPAILSFGLVLSVAWTILLGYGFIKLVELAI